MAGIMTGGTTERRTESTRAGGGVLRKITYMKGIIMNIVCRHCSCGAVECIDLTTSEYEQYRKWRRGECYIQDIGTLNACEREFLKTGLCRNCQKMIFNNDRTDRIRNAREMAVSQ